MVEKAGEQSPIPLKPKQIKQLLEHITIIVDTRENKWQHIEKYFTKRNIKFIRKKLDYGDYGFFLSQCPELGIHEDRYYTDYIVIERKNNLTELANNFGNERERFVRELERSKGAVFVLLVENASYEDIVFGRYRSKLTPEQFIATLNTFKARYGIVTEFLRNETCTGHYMLYIFRYFLREKLKNG